MSETERGLGRSGRRSDLARGDTAATSARSRVWRVAFLTLAAAVLLSSAFWGKDAAGEELTADTVFTNGRVLLYPDAHTPANYMSSKIDWAEAVAVTDGVISYVGDAEGAQRFIGPDTKVVDLKGKMLMPGLGDGHLHGGTPPQCSLNYEGGTVEDVLGKLKECLLREDQVEHLNSNYRLTASYFMGEGMQPPGTRLDRHILDRLSKDPSEDEFGTGTTRPIVVRHMDGHKVYTNTKAIENAGLDENTPDPPDGFIGRDENGYPNGQFSDYSADWGPQLPSPPDATYQGRVANIELANSLGITAILRPGGSASDLQIAKRLADEGKLTVHLNQALSASQVRGVDDPTELRAIIANLNSNRDQYDGYSNPASPGSLTVDTVKIFCDGVPEFPGQTAAMLDPYRTNVGTEDDPHWVHTDWRGEEPSCEDGRAGFIALDRAKWTIHAHTLGDRAIRVALHNIEAAMDENATWDRRHTLTHLQFVDDRDIPRFGELGVVASMSQQWNQRDAWSVDGIEGYIAPDRMDNLYPTRDFIEGGAIVAQGSDWPVTDLVPWRAIEQAITREGPADPKKAIYPGPLNPGDAITLEQALKTSTIGVAYQMHRDDVSGSIEVGKLADLIVLDSDPYDPPGGSRDRLLAAQAARKQARKKLRRAERRLQRAKAAGKPVRKSKRAVRKARRALKAAERRVAKRRAAYETAHERAIKDLSETKVLVTMVAGETVYVAPGDPLGAGDS